MLSHVDPLGKVYIAIILFLYKYYVTFISVIFDPLYVTVYNLLIPSDPVTATDVGPSLPYAILVICWVPAWNDWVTWVKLSPVYLKLAVVYNVLWVPLTLNELVALRTITVSPDEMSPIVNVLLCFDLPI